MKHYHLGLVAGLIVGLLLVPLPGAAQTGSTFDHLKCYKIKDAIKFKATATLTPEQAQFVPETCAIAGKGRFFCVPTDKDLTAFKPLNKPPIAQEVVAGQVLTDDRICYKVKCPAMAAIAPLTVTDQFGTRKIAFGKKAMKVLWMCTPALKACADTAAPTCGGFCPAGQTCETDPTGLQCECVGQQPFTCQPGITQAPECDGTCPPGEMCAAQGVCTGTTTPCLQDADCNAAQGPCILGDCDCLPSLGDCGAVGPPMCYGECVDPAKVCINDNNSGACTCQ